MTVTLISTQADVLSGSADNSLLRPLRCEQTAEGRRALTADGGPHTRHGLAAAMWYRTFDIGVIANRVVMVL